MITACQTRFEDLLRVCGNLRAEEIEQNIALSDVDVLDPVELAIQHWQLSGIKVTIMKDDQPLVCAGWIETSKGVWTSWMCGTQYAWDNHGVSITRISRRVMAMLIDSGAKRLEGSCLEKRVKVCHWFQKGLKMQLEGVRRAAGKNGENLAEFAMIHPELEPGDNGCFRIKEG